MSGTDTLDMGRRWAGFKDSLCFHRCIVFFVHDHNILVKTGQCFGLNGFISLGSILLWNSVLAPHIRWLLKASLPNAAAADSTYVDATYYLLCGVFGVLWLVPVYCVSFPLSCVWYQQIAEMAVRVNQEKLASKGAGKAKAPRITQQQDFMEQVAQELYRVVLFAVFFLEIYIISFLPYVGAAANFLLLSWLNALYSFDYKWALTNRRLPERIQIFEQHWAFFAGFGSVCTLATLRWSFFSGAAFLAMIYPLFILIACNSEPMREHRKVMAREEAAGRKLASSRLPIFYTAIHLTNWVVERGPKLLLLPVWLWQRSLYFALAAGLAVALVCLTHVLY